MKCLICGKRSGFLSRLCRSCRPDFPTDFSLDRPIEEIMTEYRRNTRLKEKFSPDKKLGSMELDMLNGIFHYGNIYRSVTELKEHAFHSSTPKFEGLIWRRDIVEDIYFTYRLRNGVKNQIKIDTAVCPYRNDGRYVTVEPPLKLFGYKQQFAECMQSAKDNLLTSFAESNVLSDEEYI